MKPNLTFFAETFRTLFGDFSVAVNKTGAVTGTAFGDRAALLRRLPACELAEDRALTRAAREQLLAYFAGDRRDFDLPLAPAGTAFQQNVWTTLLAIPRGETRTYGQLAAQLGNPAASRAVGRANATNPVCVIIPCHRVVGADGTLTGFAFGEKLKRRLLELERVPAFRAA